MHVLVTYLHKNAAALREQVSCNGQPVTEVGEVGVNSITPRVAERLDLLGLASDVFGFAVLDVSAGGGPLEVGVELDAVGRIKVDALHLAA